MKFSSQSLSSLAAAAVVLMTACSKTPSRPDPSATLLGGGQEFLTPQNLGTTFEPGSGLEMRDGTDLNNEIRGLLESVYFDFDRSNIKEAERAKLRAAADYLRDNPNSRLLLEGHCDWRGTAEYNLGLGDRRATSALDYLATLGVDESRLETLSKGDLEATRDADEATMAQDRRVEFVILPM